MISLNTKQNLAYKIESLSDSQINSLLEFIGQNENINQEITEKEDDLISSLAKMRENKRASQVFEWESARRGISRAKLSGKQAA